MLAFDFTGRRLLTRTQNGTLRLLDVDKGQELYVLQPGTNRVTKAEFDPEGRRVHVTMQDGSIWIWDPDKRAELHPLEPSDHSKRADIHSPDGQITVRIARSRRPVGHPPDRFQIKAYSSATDELLGVLNRDDVSSVSFSPDSKRLIGYAWNTVYIWDAFSGRELLSWEAHEHPLRFARFSPSGRYVLTKHGSGEAVTRWSSIPWESEALPGDDSMDWHRRFAEWQKARTGQTAPVRPEPGSSEVHLPPST
jgi:WD40 repeat protein